MLNFLAGTKGIYIMQICGGGGGGRWEKSEKKKRGKSKKGRKKGVKALKIASLWVLNSKISLRCMVRACFCF